MLAARETAAAWSASAAGTSWALGPGDVLANGRRVLRRLGAGGAHEVFLVARVAPAPAVAKLLRPHLTGDLRCLRHLREEGRALDRLAHPALPRRLDTVLGGSHPHLLLEYVPGPTLREEIRRGPVRAEVVASAGAAIARALAHIATAGWVHLDVTPSNIVLGATPRLLDFELCRSLEDAARISAPVGTWGFMPPEQRAVGTPSASAIGSPADVYSLAACLADALAGAPPPERASERRAALRGGLGALLHEALAPAPADRPAVGELAGALAAHAAGGGFHHAPPGISPFAADGPQLPGA